MVLAAAILLLGFRAQADEPLVAQIGNANIKIPLPAGMAEMPQDAQTVKMLDDMTPEGCVLLRACIESDALDPAQPQGQRANTRECSVFAFKDVQQDIYSGDFLNFVGKVANTAVHGVLESENSYFDFEETQKRLDQFQKDTGIALQPDGALYSLGMVSRSGGCVSFMTAEYLTVTRAGKMAREKCVTVEGYLLLNNKLVLVLTSLSGPNIFSSDLLPLMHAAEKYQIALQILNP